MYTESMTTIPLSAARPRLFDLADRAASGECITLTSHGAPKARLVPIADDPRPRTFTREQALDILLHRQLDSGAWAAIRFPGDTIGEDGLG